MSTLPLTPNKLFIIDGNSYIYRAYYAVRNLTNSKGFPTNAVYGFVTMLFKIIREMKPDLLAIVFDPKGPTRRHKEFKEYKAQRPPMPKDLVPQIPVIHKLVESFRIPVFIVEGEEADDVIASLAKSSAAESMNVTIVSGDKDLLQLVGGRVTVYDPLKDKSYGPEEVRERFGVGPEQVVEIIGLMGDASDNIPGVPGIGEKTAQKLIQQYGSIENLLHAVGDVTKPKLKQSLTEHAGLARLSRDLATLQSDVPLKFDQDDLRIKEPDRNALIALLQEMEFTSLLKFVSRESEHDIVYQTILDELALKQLAERLRSSSGFCFDTETTSLDPLQAELVGISFAVKPFEASYIPLGHRYESAPRQIALNAALSILRPIFEDPAIPKTGQNIKYDILVLDNYRIKVKGIVFDTMIAAYLLNPGRASHGMDALALEYLGYKTITYTDVTGTGKKQIPFSAVNVITATRYSGEDADITLRLKVIFEQQLKEQGFTRLFTDIEMPLMEVLAVMERNGVKLDTSLLNAMSTDLGRDLDEVEKTIYRIADTTFNINSPKQLADVLFTKLKLTPLKKTKTGFSTNVDVLEELAHAHPLPSEILRYRTLAKLKSTYVDALPALVNSRTGRLHTSFNQAVAATGRLSSSDPNLQNIPIRTEVGRRIRKAFTAPQGSCLISADYSQIELRILAHLSNDPALIETFRKDEDVHTRTASEIFSLPPDAVTPEMRRKAKAVNFGIIYGISAFGLAQDIGVSNAEAKRYIDDYFARYPRVQEFIRNTIESAKQLGYVSTMFGRRRFIPELASPVLAVRNFGERTAVNTPIQGTAADLIKIAMINIHRSMASQRLSSLMILQVHDELVFEVPDHELAAMKDLVKKEMESAAVLAVPIKVDMGSGRNWDEAH